MNSLPEEISLRVFSYLDPKELWSSLPVSRTWNGTVCGAGALEEIYPQLKNVQLPYSPQSLVGSSDKLLNRFNRAMKKIDLKEVLYLTCVFPSVLGEEEEVPLELRMRFEPRYELMFPSEMKVERVVEKRLIFVGTLPQPEGRKTPPFQLGHRLDRHEREVFKYKTNFNSALIKPLLEDIVETFLACQVERREKAWRERVLGLALSACGIMLPLTLRGTKLEPLIYVCTVVSLIVCAFFKGTRFRVNG